MRRCETFVSSVNRPNLFYEVSTHCSMASLLLLASSLPRPQSAILPSCHPAILPFCHPAILPSCHSAILPFCHPAILPSCHSAVDFTLFRSVPSPATQQPRWPPLPPSSRRATRPLTPASCTASPAASANRSLNESCIHTRHTWQASPALQAPHCCGSKAQIRKQSETDQRLIRN